MKKSLRKLFLDDVRIPYDSSWDVVKSHREFISYIDTHGIPDVVSLDHDLHPSHYREYDRTKGRDFDYSRVTVGTGIHCLAYLLDKVLNQVDKPLPDIIIHTANPIGQTNLLTRAKYFKITVGQKSEAIIKGIDYDMDFMDIRQEYEGEIAKNTTSKTAFYLYQ